MKKIKVWSRHQIKVWSRHQFWWSDDRKPSCRNLALKRWMATEMC